jgi:tRNA-dihydrouridine synthase
VWKAANGFFFSLFSDGIIIGCAGVMIARGAEANVSVFRKEGRLPLMDIVRQYMRKVSVFYFKPATSERDYLTHGFY